MRKNLQHSEKDNSLKEYYKKYNYITQLNMIDYIGIKNENDLEEKIEFYLI